MPIKYLQCSWPEDIILLSAYVSCCPHITVNWGEATLISAVLHSLHYCTGASQSAAWISLYINKSAFIGLTAARGYVVKTKYSNNYRRSRRQSTLSCSLSVWLEFTDRRCASLSLSAALPCLQCFPVWQRVFLYSVCRGVSWELRYADKESRSNRASKQR